MKVRADNNWLSHLVKDWLRDSIRTRLGVSESMVIRLLQFRWTTTPQSNFAHDWLSQIVKVRLGDSK